MQPLSIADLDRELLGAAAPKPTPAPAPPGPLSIADLDRELLAATAVPPPEWAQVDRPLALTPPTAPAAHAFGLGLTPAQRSFDLAKPTPYSMGQEVLNAAAKGILSVPEAAQTGIEIAGIALGSPTLQRAGRLGRQVVEREVAQFPRSADLEGNVIDNTWDLLGNPRWWAAGIAEMAPGMVASILPAGAAFRGLQIGGRALEWTPALVNRLAQIGGTAAGSAVGGTLEGSQTYKQALEMGKTPEEAAAAAAKMAAVVAGLEAIGLQRTLKPFMTGRGVTARQAAGAALAEGLSEGAEEPAQSVILEGRVTPQSLKDAATVFPLAAVTGAGASVATGVRRAPGRRQVPEPAANPSLDALRGALAGLGYTPEDMATMNPGQAAVIARGGIRKPEAATPWAAEAPAPPAAPVAPVSIAEVDATLSAQPAPPVPETIAPAPETPPPTVVPAAPVPETIAPAVDTVPAPPARPPRAPRAPAADEAIDATRAYGAVLDLADPTSITRYIKGRRGLSPSGIGPAEYARIPLDLKRRDGASFEDVAAEAGVDAQELLNALTDLSVARQAKRKRVADEQAAQAEAYADTVPPETATAHVGDLTEAGPEAIPAARPEADADLAAALDFFDQMAQQEREATRGPAAPAAPVPEPGAPAVGPAPARVGLPVPDPGAVPGGGGPAGIPAGAPAESAGPRAEPGAALPLGAATAPAGPPAAALPAGRPAPGRGPRSVAPPAPGAPFAATVYQGRGAPAAMIYSPAVLSAGGGAILGPGQYYAFTEEDAGRYGDDVQAHPVRLQRPLELTSDDQWVNVLRGADAMHLYSRGPQFSRDPEGIPGAIDRLRADLERRGYDGVIVRGIPTRGDVNPAGASIKALRDSFGHDQVIAFGAPAAVAARPAPGRGGATAPAVPTRGLLGPEHPLLAEDTPVGTEVYQTIRGEEVTWRKVGGGYNTSRWVGVVAGKRRSLTGTDVWNLPQDDDRKGDWPHRFPDDPPGMRRTQPKYEPLSGPPEETAPGIIDVTAEVLPPRVERTALGDQTLIPGTPVRALPGRGIRATTPQADVRDTPLFGQERVAAEGEQAEIPTSAEVPTAADRPTYADGRLIPRVGDRVYMDVPGFGGSAASIQGEVIRGRRGEARVQITGSGTMFGDLPVQGAGRTRELTPQWTVVGDPEIKRREEHATAKRRADEQARAAAQHDYEETARASAKAAVMRGAAPLTIDVEPGTTIRNHFDQTDMVVTEVERERGWIFARPADEPTAPGGSLGNQLWAYTVPAAAQPARPAPGRPPVQKAAAPVEVNRPGWRFSESFNAPSGKTMTYWHQEFGPFAVMWDGSTAQIVNKPANRRPVPFEEFGTVEQGMAEADSRRDRIYEYEYRRTRNEAPPEWGARPAEDIAPPAEPARPAPGRSEIVHTVTNPEDGTSAVVAKVDGGYSVTVRDDDAGAYIPTSVIYPTLEAAKAKADEVLGPAAAPPAEPAPPAPPPGATYEHAERLRLLVDRFEERLRANRLPRNAGELRRLAADWLEVDQAAIGQDAAAVDDLFDALETAVNRVYRERRSAESPFDVQVSRAQAAEGWMANRLRTIELTARQQFSTPLPLAEGAAYALDARPGETVLEPTAGTGNLLAPLPPEVQVRAVEVDPRRAEALRLQGYPVEPGDWLPMSTPASVVITNPPWGKYTTTKYGAAIPMPYGNPVDVAERFVVKALRSIPEGGRVAAIMPTTILRSPSFLRWLEDTHTLRALIQSPPEAYNTRGTTVDSVLLVVDKGRTPDAPAALRATPGSWQEWIGAVRPLAGGGTHARVSGPVRPGDPGRPESAGLSPAPAAERPGRVPPADARPAPGRAEPAAEPADAGRGEPGRDAPAEVQGVVARPAPGRGAGPDVGAVDAGGGGVEPAGPGDVVRGPAPGAGPDLGPARFEGGEAARFAVADPEELAAAQRSQVFAPAPLRAGAGSNPHPRLIVKTRSLAGAPLPTLTYQPRGALLQDAYARRVISDAQWDYGIIPALQAAARGHGYLAAADVGVGKTRIAAGVVGEWLQTGTARVLYVTAGEVNIQDVKQQFNDYAGGEYPFPILEVKSFKDAAERPGKDPAPLPRETGAVYIIDRYNLAKYRRALMALGVDAIVGDEAHLYKNIEGAAVGQAWLAIQTQTLQRNGKFLYLTATPATAFDDLQHFIGLKEWTADGFTDYVLRVTGQSPVARGDLNALAERYEALRTRYRDLDTIEPDVRRAFLNALPDPDGPSFQHRREEKVDRYRQAIQQLEDALRGVPEPVSVGTDAEDAAAHQGPRKGKRGFGGVDAFNTHIAPAEMEQIMRELAMKGKYDSVDLWRAGVEFEIATTKLTAAQQGEYAKITTFFRQLNQDFMRFGRLNKQAGRLLTIRHFLQQEAKRRMFDYRLGPALEAAKAALARGEQVVISTISVSEGKEESGPIPAAINTINTREVEVDPDSGEITRDDVIPEALERRAELLDEWMRLRQPRSPVDLVLEAFGKDQVAVVTGSTPAKAREKMIREFQEGSRRVALISGAGKTGISLHHVLNVGKGAKGRRHLIVTDYEWSATTFKQELGRVDRSGQVSAPKVTVLSTGAAGERKFLATIANRMRNLGALSKGSAESASNDQLAEFEIGGGLDTHAMRLAYRGLDPEHQALFIAGVWKDPSSRDASGEARNTASYPQRAALKDFLLDLQFMPIADADRAFEAFWAERERLIRNQEEGQGDLEGVRRTRTYSGTIVRSTPLRDDLTLHEVKDTNGHRLAILQGLVTDHMDRLAKHLPTQTKYGGPPVRSYVSFRAGERQVAGLEVRIGSAKAVAREFGESLGGGELRTAAEVREALEAGDRVPLQGQGDYSLRLRPSDQRIVLEGGRMRDKAELLRHGVVYSPAGNLWIVKDLDQVLARWPVRQRPRPGETPPDSPLTEEGGFLDLSRLLGRRGAAVSSPAIDKIEQMNQRAAPGRSTARQQLDRLITTQVNRFHPLHRLTDWLIAAGHTPAPGEAPVEVAELAKGTMLGQTEDWLIRLRRVLDAAEREDLGPALNAYLTYKQMEKRIRDLVPRSTFMAGVSASGYRTVQGVLMPQTVNPLGEDTAQIRADLQRLEQDVGPQRWRQLEAFARDVWAMNREVLDQAHDAGIVSDEAYQVMVGRGDDYVPFQVLDYLAGEQKDASAPLRPYSVRYQDFLRGLTGTERDVRNVMAASLDKATRAFALINRNRAARAITDLAGVLPQIREIGGTTFQAGPGEGVVEAFVDGHRHNYAVPEDIARAVLFLDEGQIGLLGKIAQAAAAPLRAGATGANVAFLLTNLPRDVAATTYWSKYGIQNPADGARFVADWVQGAWSAYRQDADFLAALRSGAVSGTFQGALTPEQVLRQAAGIWSLEASLPRRILDAMLYPAVRANQVFEQASKMATVRRGQRQGAGAADVVYETANYGGSPNFLRAGTWGRELNLLWMFYNARLQGSARIVRRVREAPGRGAVGVGAKALTRLGLLSLLPATLLYFWNSQYDDDKGLEEIAPEERQRFHILLLPDLYQHSDGTTRRMYVKIAKEEGAALAMGLLEAGLDYWKRQDGEAFAKATSDALGSISPISFTVRDLSLWGAIRAAGHGVMAGVNPAIRVPAELGGNFKYYTGTPIVPRGLEDNVLPEDQVRPTTSRVVTAVARALGVSPLKLEYAITSSTGGLGGGLLDAADAVTGQSKIPELAGPWEQTTRIPAVQRLLGRGGDHQARQAEERFYTVLDEARRARGSVNQNAEQGAPDRVQALVGDPAHRVKVALLSDLEEIARELGEAREAQAFLAGRQADSLPSERRRAALQAIATARAAVLRAVTVIERATDGFRRPLPGLPAETPTLQPVAAGGESEEDDEE